MKKQMKLRCKITLEDDRSYTAKSALFDGTPFSIRVDHGDIELTDEFLPTRRTVDGWVKVVQESEQDGRAYLTLPKPTIEFGKQVSVSNLSLMPVGATINDFIGRGKKQVLPSGKKEVLPPGKK